VPLKYELEVTQPASLCRLRCDWCVCRWSRQTGAIFLPLILWVYTASPGNMSYMR